MSNLSHNAKEEIRALLFYYWLPLKDVQHFYMKSLTFYDYVVSILQSFFRTI